MKKTCHAPGCRRLARAKGFCYLHYQRHKNGRPLDAPIAKRVKGPIEKRLRAYLKIDAKTGCHLWTGCRDLFGYGCLMIDRSKLVRAHRVKAQIIRELDRLEVLMAQLKAVEAERDALLEGETSASPARMLAHIKGIGPEFAAVLWSEGLFRHFDNRRQLAAYAGLAPTPWKSGSIDHEQGVSRAGNPRLRTAMVQLAWLWLRHQPASPLSLWFHERVQRAGPRMRKKTIVALARKLLVALWRHTSAGVLVEGVVMKAA